MKAKFKIYANTVPSLERNFFEGVTTRIYNLSLNDKVMKFVHYWWNSRMEAPNIFSDKDEEIVYSPNKYRETEGQMKRYFKTVVYMTLTVLYMVTYKCNSVNLEI